MSKIIAMGASNSQASINKSLASYAAGLTEHMQVETLDLNDYPLPLYGTDVERKTGVPENAKKLSEKIQAADGIVLSLAEHNGSFASAFKNTVDWMSRLDMKVWKNKPMLLLSTSPGGRGGASVMAHAKAIMPYAGANIVGSFSLPSFHDNFAEGRIKNDELKEALVEQINQFVNAVNN